MMEKMDRFKFSDIPGIFKPKLKIKDIQKAIRGKTGITEENQRFQVVCNLPHFGLYNTEDSFWDFFELEICDVSRFRVKLEKEYYQEDVFLDLNKKVEELKQLIFEQTKIPVDRQKICLNELEKDNCAILKDEDLFKDQITIKIEEQSNDKIYVKYPDSTIKEITTDLCITGFKFIKNIDSESLDEKSPLGFHIKYNLFFNGRKLDFQNLLVNSGIKNGDTIELRERKNMKISVKHLTGKVTEFKLDPFDSTKLLYIFVDMMEGYSPILQRLIFQGHQLSDNKTLNDYNIQDNSTVNLVLRLG